MAPERDQVREKMRRAYERGRVRDALMRTLPVAVIAGLACLIGERRPGELTLAGVLCGTAFLFLWRGRHLGRGVLPGLLAGAVPFAAAHLARNAGHACAGGSCYSTCVLACVGGAVIAGVVIGRFARRSEAPRLSWLAAGTVALLTGSLACACIGLTGIVGLVAGVMVASTPMVLIAAPRPG